MFNATFYAKIPGGFAEETLIQEEFSMPCRHLHEGMELYFLLEGERCYFIEQDTYHVKQGMAVLIDRNQIHKTSVAGGSSYEHRRFLLQIDASVLDAAFHLPGFPEGKDVGAQYWGVAEFSQEDWAQALAVIEMLKSELTRREPESDGMALLLVTQLLTLFVRSRRHQEIAFRKNQSSSHRINTGMYQTVHEIALYLQNHSADKCTLDEMASRFFVSRSYLTRIFKSITGFTITEYLTVCRIRKAQMLLIETELKITEIAACTGFGNITYFEKIFKGLNGMTPLQYRRRAGKRTGHPGTA